MEINTRTIANKYFNYFVEQAKYYVIANTHTHT